MKPTENLGYLLHHFSAVLDRQSDQLLQESLDIGFSQFKILMALKLHTGVQQKQIAETLGQTEASISRQIKLMTEMSLLQSVVNPANRREHRTTLTFRGDRVTEQAIALLNDFHTPMFDRLDGNERRYLLSALQAMHTHVCAGNKTGACRQVHI